MASETELAPAEAPPEAKPAGGAKALLSWLGAMLILTLLATGAGAGLGLHLVGSVESALKEQAAAADQPVVSRYAGDTNLKRLAPIVTNLASPQDTWIRVEASIVFDGEALPASEIDVVAGEITEDILAFLRTVSLPQIQGASGLQHLSEDLNERAAIRSDRRVRELILETLVVQ